MWLYCHQAWRTSIYSFEHLFPSWFTEVSNKDGCLSDITRCRLGGVLHGSCQVYILTNNDPLIHTCSLFPFLFFFMCLTWMHWLVAFNEDKPGTWSFCKYNVWVKGVFNVKDKVEKCEHWHWLKTCWIWVNVALWLIKSWLIVSWCITGNERHPVMGIRKDRTERSLKPLKSVSIFQNINKFTCFRFGFSQDIIWLLSMYL